MSELAGILLAAGASDRLGRPKQLVRLAGETLIRRQAALLSAHATDTVVVLGAHAEEIAAELAKLPVRIQRNAAWSEGMGASLACGVAALHPHTEAVLVLLCDQYRLGANDLASLTAAWHRSPDAPVVARWPGAFGPPAIFPRSCFEDLSRLSGEGGARKIVEAPGSGTVFVDLVNAEYDLDEAGDLQQLRHFESS